MHFTSGDGKSDPVPLVFTIGNRSSQPATHVIVTIGLDSRLTISSTGDYEGPLRRSGSEFNYLRLLIRPPEWLPVFKEAPEDELSTRELHVRISADSSTPKDFLIAATLQSPGFTREQRWKLTDDKSSVELSEIE
jgi:hypothetical protein